MRMLLPAILTLFLLLAPRPVAAQTAPSFDCMRAATAIERAICHDPALAEADATMARLFAVTQVSALGEGPSNVLATQREWLRDRAKCLAVAGTFYTSREDCLSTSYHIRNEELAVAALFVQPEMALAALRKLDPGLAPIYDALFRYVSHPAGTDWSSAALAADRAALLDLIRPLYEQALAAPEQNLARDMLREEVPTLDEALSDDLGFGHTLTLLALLNDSDKGAPMTMPCAAMIRRPGLGMTDPLFGSSYDMGIPISDCDLTMPPLARFDLFVKDAEANRPQCDGSMRYMAYREFRGAVDDARLGAGLGAEPEAGKSFQMSDRRMNRFTDAILELMVYYVKYFHATSGAARRAAVQAVVTVEDTSQKCGGEE